MKLIIGGAVATVLLIILIWICAKFVPSDDGQDAVENHEEPKPDENDWIGIKIPMRGNPFTFLTFSKRFSVISRNRMCLNTYLIYTNTQIHLIDRIFNLPLNEMNNNYLT